MRKSLRWLRDSYLTVDPRSLGFFRIGLGVLLLSDLLRRFHELEFWYTNEGLLPNHTLLWRPAAKHVFSLFFMASNASEATLIFAFCALVYLLLTFGVRTRLMQVLALVCRVSLNSRIAMLENGGDMVMNLLCILTLALPLGRRFSVDAWLGRTRRDDPAVSFAALALLLQFAAIYFFNAISKDGYAWRDGSAVHFALHLDKFATPLGVWMREHLPARAIRALSWSALAVEWSAPVLILTPVFRHTARTIAVLVLPLLHLSFGLGLNLGGFSPAMMAFFPLLLTDEHWAFLGRRARLQGIAAACRRKLNALQPYAAQLVPGRRERPGRVSVWLREGAVALLVFAIVSEALNENASVPAAMHIRQPAWAKSLIEYPRLLQGWRMFAPTPPDVDSMIHVDATTSEGVHVDPYNLVASRHVFPDGKTVPQQMDQSQFFVMYTDRIAMAGYADYRQAFLEWLLLYPQRTGKPADCLVAFDVYYVSDKSPPLGSQASTPVERTRFMQYRAPADGACRPKTDATPSRAIASARTP